MTIGFLCTPITKSCAWTSTYYQTWLVLQIQHLKCLKTLLQMRATTFNGVTVLRASVYQETALLTICDAAGTCRISKARLVNFVIDDMNSLFYQAFPACASRRTTDLHLSPTMEDSCTNASYLDKGAIANRIYLH
jgi:hypothetical protein